jgi:hypothetical protein
VCGKDFFSDVNVCLSDGFEKVLFDKSLESEEYSTIVSPASGFNVTVYTCGSCWVLFQHADFVGVSVEDDVACEFHSKSPLLVMPPVYLVDLFIV